MCVINLLTLLFVYLSSRDIVEMNNSHNQEHDRNGESSTSDDDSLSLLCNLNARPRRGAAEEMDLCNSESQVGCKEQEKEKQLEINQPPESEISSCAWSAACCANSTTQLGNRHKTSCDVIMLIPH